MNKTSPRHKDLKFAYLKLSKITLQIEYEIFGEGSHISTNQKREKGAFSLLIG